MEICSKMTGLEALDGAYLVHTDAADIKIIFLTEEIVRIRASFNREFAEESYVLMATAASTRCSRGSGRVWSRYSPRSVRLPTHWFSPPPRFALYWIATPSASAFLTRTARSSAARSQEIPLSWIPTAA